LTVPHFGIDTDVIEWSGVDGHRRGLDGDAFY